MVDEEEEEVAASVELTDSIFPFLLLLLLPCLKTDRQDGHCTRPSPV